jgi:hypothetical protein
MKDGLPSSTFKTFSEYKTKQIADVENDGSHELAMKQARGLGYKVGKNSSYSFFTKKEGGWSNTRCSSQTLRHFAMAHSVTKFVRRIQKNGQYTKFIPPFPGSSVGIATGYGRDGPGIESRLGARFSAPVHTGPGAHPASCTRGIGSFPGVESGWGVTLTPHPF